MPQFLSSTQAETERRPAERLRVMSWNLLRRIGAGVGDVADLASLYRPDLFLMQEATVEIADLPKLIGGTLIREPMARRIYGLAAWSPHPIRSRGAHPLPVSKLPGRVPPRLAQIVEIDGVSFANVHLSHGQLLNRRQLASVMQTLQGPAAIIGDYNAVGPVYLSEFHDIGPRRRTHRAANVIPLRLDRCMARGLRCVESKVLERGPSDHHPILLELEVAD
jgi:endonuclease/exonuclease/phosphatase family metal-dependent hydrolase